MYLCSETMHFLLQSLGTSSPNPIWGVLLTRDWKQRNWRRSAKSLTHSWCLIGPKSGEMRTSRAEITIGIVSSIRSVVDLRPDRTQNLNSGPGCHLSSKSNSISSQLMPLLSSQFEAQVLGKFNSAATSPLLWVEDDFLVLEE